MMGVSYGGISQLFVGPDAPAEPGGDHAAVGDRQHRHDALPGRDPQHRLRPVLGQGPRPRRAPGVADRRPALGLRAHPERRHDLQGQPGAAPEAVDLLHEDRRATATTSRRSPTRSRPSTFVHKIHAPVFLACQWTDEQTGGHCADAGQPLHGHAAQVVHVHQRHAHRLARPGDVQPLVRLPRALRRPAARRACPPARALAPTIYSAAHGRPGRQPAGRPDPGASPTTARRKSAFEALPPVRILFDNGAGGSAPGAPVAGLRAVVRALPAARARTARSWYLGTAGRCATPSPSAAGAGRVHLGHGGPARDRASPATPARAACGRATPAYTGSRTRPGTRALLRDRARSARRRPSSAPARCTRGSRPRCRRSTSRPRSPRSGPDGKETFVQNGWLRSDGRKLDRRKSTLLEPVPTLRERDAAPLPARPLGEGRDPALLPGPRVPQGLADPRRRSRAPGGDQPVWAFADADAEGHGDGADRPLAGATRRGSCCRSSRGSARRPPLPPCPGLRGEPCRAYQPLANAPAS